MIANQRHHFLATRGAKPINTLLAGMTQEEGSAARTIVRAYHYKSPDFKTAID